MASQYRRRLEALERRLTSQSNEAGVSDLGSVHPGVFAEQELGYVNAEFHWEWYGLAQTEQRLCVVAPREHAKSEVFTVVMTAWASIYQPGTWTYVFAQTGDQAEKLKERVDRVVSTAAPWMVDGARVMRAKESVYANGTMITVAGAGKAVRGAHPDVIIGDDVLDEATTATAHMRRRTERWWFGTVGGMAHPGTVRTLPTADRVTMPPTRVRLVGTPFHADDLLMSMRKNPIWVFYRYAAEFDPSQLPKPGESLAVEIR
jgi:hypothetical protein